jgi:hypothetical protein
MWGYRCDRRLNWYHGDRAFKPVRFTAEGAPVYDLARVERLPGELGARGHVGDVYKTKFGYVLQAPRPDYQDPHGTIHGLIQLEGYDKEGRLRWTYPSYWNSVHGAFTAPMAMPGVIMGALKISGLVEPEVGRLGKPSSHQHDIISIRGNTGQEFLIRDDGLYVAELFTDQRMAPDELPDEEQIAGAPINATTLGGEPFSGWIARQRDGRVRMTYGQNDVRIAEVVGLETVRELPPTSLSLSDRDVELAREFQPDVTDRLPTTSCAIQRGGAFDVNRLEFPDDAISIRRGRDEDGRARLRFDDHHLYAAWQVFDLTPLVNEGGSPELAFKSGDCVGLLIAEDDEYERHQLGGTRIVIAWLRGKPTAVVHHPAGPGDKPFTFESPVRKITFPHVAVEPAIELAAQRRRQDYLVTAKIPWRVLNLKPRDGLRLRGDVEVIFGGGQTSRVERIIRWVDRQTNVVNDTPTEAEIFPARWGTFYLGGRHLQWRSQRRRRRKHVRQIPRGRSRPGPFQLRPHLRHRQRTDRSV